MLDLRPSWTGGNVLPAEEEMMMQRTTCWALVLAHGGDRFATTSAHADEVRASRVLTGEEALRLDHGCRRPPGSRLPTFSTLRHTIRVAMERTFGVRDLVSHKVPDSFR